MDYKQSVFKRLSIQSYLYGLALLIAFMMGLLGIVATVVLSELTVTTTKLSENTAFFLNLSRIQEKTTALNQALGQATTLRDKSMYRSYQVQYNDLLNDLQALIVQIESGDQKESLVEARHALEQADLVAQNIAGLLDAGAYEAAELEFHIVDGFHTDTISTLKKIHLESVQGLNTELETLEAGVETPYWTIVIASFIISCLVLLVILFVARHITCPIFHLDDAVNKVAAGDDTVEVPVDSVREVSILAGSFNNMTRKIRERALESMQERVEEAETANRMKTEFLANISHELRTPMNAILGFSELLYQQIKNDTHQGYTEAILTSGRNLMVLINDILDLSKIEAGKMEVQNTPTVVRSLFHEVAGIYKTRAIEKNLTFDIEMDPDLPEVLYLDSVRLRQILVNLIGNAIKFTGVGSVRLRVQRTPFAQDDSTTGLVIEVIDTGIGIPPDQMDRIFDEFVQQSGQSNRTYGGTGLGLAITRRLIELMGGQISVTSVPYQGSTFRVELNHVRIASDESRVLSEDKIESAASDIHFEPNTLLVVEDNEMIRTVIQEYLQAKGLQVFEAENGEIALYMISHCDPAVILMDLQMPIMDGFKATQELRADPQFSTTPIIAITANAMEKDQEQAMEAGCDEFLAKPISIHELADVLTRYLPHSKTESEISPAITEQVNASLSSFSEEEIAQLVDLVGHLKTVFMTRWEGLVEVMIPKEIQVFGSEVKALGTEHHLDAFESWGAQVERFAQEFRIEELNQTLATYPNMVDQIQYQIGTGEDQEVKEQAGMALTPTKST